MISKYFLRDDVSSAISIVDYAHHEVHGGNHYHLTYSVASVGAMTSPNDMITLGWKTPNTTKWIHFVFGAQGSAGARIRLIEGKTGGATGPTGTLSVYNNNRNSIKTSTILSVSGTAAKVTYDGSLFTGGTTLHDEYIGGADGPNAGGGSARGENEFVLKQNEFYQLSILDTGTNPGSLVLSWYEHTNKR